ncbi:MAG TPA: penicillin-binding protein 2 [Mycobacterium sp.]|nr:penicillin-binding protein 2 [Mycobacterium sp.]
MSVLADPAPVPRKSASRFLSFGVVVILAVSVLTGRLFYMQVMQGVHYTQLSTGNAIVQEPIPSSRGLIYDRAGRLLVTNVPSFSVKIRPADLPFSVRAVVVTRLAGILDLDPAQINQTIDSNPGSRFDPIRIAQDVPEATARLIAEQHLELPGVEVVVEARREYTDGKLFAQILGYTGPIDGQQLKKLAANGYLPDDMIGKTGVEATYESQLRGVYGAENVERDATGRQIQVVSTARDAQAGDSLVLSIDTEQQKEAQQALTWGMQVAGLKRGVMIVMNPQTGEVLAMVSLPTYDDNAFAHGISNKDYQALLNDKQQPLLNHAVNEQYPPGSTFKLVTGTGGLADHKITPTSTVNTVPYLTLGNVKFWDWNHSGWGPLTIFDGFGHSSDTFFFQVAGMLGIERLSYWAHQYGFGKPTGIDLPGEVSGIVPSNQWKQDTFGQPIYPGEVYQAGIGQGYDTVTPIQLINAYCALANGGNLYQPQIVREVVGPDGSVVRPFKPILLHKLNVPSSVLQTMRLAARRVVTIRHTYNLVELPIVVAGKSGTAEFGLPDAKGRLPYHSWFVAFVPKNGDPAKPDSQLAVLAFAYDSQTLGNVATEIVKYYLQIHFHIKHDYRLFTLLQKSNFYVMN